MTPTAATASAGMALSASVQEARDAAQQKRQADMKSALTALQSLKKSRGSAGEEQKAAARQKIEQIKARIRMMRMSMPADPKAAARMVAQLARELGAAVKAYASAGGSVSDLGASGAPQATANDATAPGEGEAAAPDADASAAAATEASAHSPEPGKPEPGKDAEKTSPEGARRDDPYRQAMDRQQAEAADRNRRAAETQADKEVLAEVKKLVRDLRAMLKQVAQSSTAPRTDGLPDQDAREAEKALASVEDTVADATTAMSGAGVSITV